MKSMLHREVSFAGAHVIEERPEALIRIDISASSELNWQVSTGWQRSRYERRVPDKT